MTLLVGDQGCGKSTMLKIISGIAKNEQSIEKDFDVIYDDIIQSNIMKLDLEYNNPRTGKGANPNDSASLLYGMSVKFQSHGEVLVPILDLIKDVKDAIILLDEPETSLSLRSQYNMITIFKEALKRNNQIILATHNIVFMEAFEDCILSLEHKKYVNVEKFIKLQKEPSNFKEQREDKIIKKTHCKQGIGCKCANETGWYNNKCGFYIKSR